MSGHFYPTWIDRLPRLNNNINPTPPPSDHINKVMAGVCSNNRLGLCIKQCDLSHKAHVFLCSFFYRRTYSRTPRPGRPGRLRASSVVVWSLSLAMTTTRPGARPRRRQGTRTFRTRQSWRWKVVDCGGHTPAGPASGLFPNITASCFFHVLPSIPTAISPLPTPLTP